MKKETEAERLERLDREACRRYSPARRLGKTEARRRYDEDLDEKAEAERSSSVNKSLPFVK